MSSSLTVTNNTANTTYEMKPNNKLYTCLACEVAFPTNERQRDHYRTDWHKYNLKRKIAHLSAVNAEQFKQKLMALQERNKQTEEKGLIYECLPCRKSYLSLNAYNNHITSKKHLELEQRAELVDNEHDKDVSMSDTKARFDQPENPSVDCLFCHQHSESLDANLMHMTQKHSFFLPDVEYLKDTEGLIHYLSDKINTSHLCLYCNGRGRTWSSASAARAHMINSGHCKLAYDESENPEELLKYYDFGLIEDSMDIDQKPVEEGGEIVLEDGTKIGHRKFLQHYKKQHTRKQVVPEPKEEEKASESLETLRRKERRHLAITDGKEQNMKKTADGVLEAAKKQEFKKKLSLKQNENVLFRFRTSTPIV